MYCSRGAFQDRRKPTRRSRRCSGCPPPARWSFRSRQDAARRLYRCRRRDLRAGRQYGDTGIPVAADHLIDFGARRSDTSEMRGGLQAGFGNQTGNGCMGALAGRATSAVGHGNEVWIDRRKRLDGFPEYLFQFVRLGREEFKGYLEAGSLLARTSAVWRRGTCVGILAVVYGLYSFAQPRWRPARQANFNQAIAVPEFGISSVMRRGSRPTQMETVSLPPSLLSGLSFC